MYIREFIGKGSISKTDVPLTESFFQPVANGLIRDIEGIHADLPTRNFTRYKAQALLNSRERWLKPYPKPVIMHHNDQDGKTIGRIKNVKFVENGIHIDKPALHFNVSITDKEGAEQVADGRLLTTSIGAKGTDVRCSICNSDIYDSDGCENHARGMVYNGEVAYWDIYDMEPKEISYVIVPSDPYAGTIQMGESQSSIPNLKESDLGIDNNKGGKKVSKELELEIEDLKAQLQAKEAEKAELEKSTEQEKTEANEKFAALEEKLKLLQEELDTLKVEKKELEEKEEKLKVEVLTEKELRESAEKSILELKESNVKTLAETLNSLRKAAGRPELAESVLVSRSSDSLKNSIEDMEIELKEAQTSIQKIEDPTLQDEFKQKEVNKSSSVGNIDLEEALNLTLSGKSRY